MATFYTSDLHLGHARVIEYSNRPFKNVDEMDEGLVANWNAVVQPSDMVYLVGDVSFHRHEKTLWLLSRLQGSIGLVLGNHDKKLKPEGLCCMIIDRFTGEYGFLSNFAQSAITVDGKCYATTEHAFQAAKAKDEDDREMIRKAKTPAEAKRLGRCIHLRPDWESAKIGVMHDLLRKKFQIEHLRVALLGTGDAKLIEGNTWRDHFWGVCDGRGENQLGKLLMEIRDELRKVTA